MKQEITFDYLRSEYQQHFPKLVRSVEVLPDEETDSERQRFLVNGTHRLRFDPQTHAALISKGEIVVAPKTQV